MGNQGCCASKDLANDGKATTGAEELQQCDALPVGEGGLGGATTEKKVLTFEDHLIKVTLSRADGGKLGLDVDYMTDRRALPIMAISGGLAEAWNKTCPAKNVIAKGDSIIEVNGVKDSVAAIMEACKNDQTLELTLVKAMTFDHLIEDLEKVIRENSCGPTMVRQRVKEADEKAAATILEGISNKYVPSLISMPDLHALAANVAIRLMGGPIVPTRFGRSDRQTSELDTKTRELLSGGSQTPSELRKIFGAAGLDDKDIVAICAGHRFGGPWGDAPYKFDNTYFSVMVQKDLPIISDIAFKSICEKYSGDKASFFKEFTVAWAKFQEAGMGEGDLRDIL